jgi:hypothetical protein
VEVIEHDIVHHLKNYSHATSNQDQGQGIFFEFSTFYISIVNKGTKAWAGEIYNMLLLNGSYDHESSKRYCTILLLEVDIWMLIIGKAKMSPNSYSIMYHAHHNIGTVPEQFYHFWLAVHYRMHTSRWFCIQSVWFWENGRKFRFWGNGLFGFLEMDVLLHIEESKNNTMICQGII